MARTVPCLQMQTVLGITFPAGYQTLSDYLATLKLLVKDNPRSPYNAERRKIIAQIEAALKSVN